MLLGTLGTILLGNMLTRKGVKTKLPRHDLIKTSEEVIRAGHDLLRHFILWLILKYKNIIKRNLNLMVFIQEII